MTVVLNTPAWCRIFVCAVFCLAPQVTNAIEPSIQRGENIWPSFQGPPATNVQADELPLTWSPDKNIAWKTSLPGYGQSSPVVWGSRLFVTSVSGGMKENCHVCAIDVLTGKLEWQRDFESATKVENTNYVSKAAPTPVVDEQGVVALFEVGNVVALKHDGEIRWQKNLVQEYGELSSRHGLGSSLLQYGNHVLAWIERQNDPYLLAIEKPNGKTAWKAPGLGAASWSTPALLTVDSEQHVVLSGSGLVAGYDSLNGGRLWSFDGVSGNTVPTPQPCGNGQFLLGATVGRGEESGGKAADSNGIVRVAKKAAGGYQVEFKWRCKRATSSFGSPIIHDGLAYFVNATGVLFCVDATTGDEKYSERIGDSIWATPLALGSRLYFAGKSGTTTVISAGPEYRVIAQNNLWEQAAENAGAGDSAKLTRGKPLLEKSEKPAPDPQVQFAIAAVPGRVLIRTGNAVYCLGDHAAAKLSQTP
jgi:outer membrane protein assembly factor BamB